MTASATMARSNFDFCISRSSWTIHETEKCPRGRAVLIAPRFRREGRKSCTRADWTSWNGRRRSWLDSWAPADGEHAPATPHCGTSTHSTAVRRGQSSSALCARHVQHGYHPTFTRSIDVASRIGKRRRPNSRSRGRWVAHGVCPDGARRARRGTRALPSTVARDNRARYSPGETVRFWSGIGKS
jgi:hypothetical protein